MTVVCGTDFSTNARAAARVAAAIAARLGVPLQLVHVFDGPKDQLDVEVRERFRTEAAELGAELHVDVEPVIESGAADEKLPEVASRNGTRLLVVGSLGARAQGRWLLGSVAERVAQSSPVPILVVREGSRLEAWVRGDHVLRVAVGVERTPFSEAALHWAQGLRAIGPSELSLIEIVWPAAEHQRRGLSTPVPLDQLRPEVERELLAELRRWAGPTAGAAGTSFVVKPGWGRVDGHLARVAADLDVDLLVVGTHRRAGIARLWQGSVSRGVLHGATMSVACVPRGGSAVAAKPTSDEPAARRSGDPPDTR